MSIVGKALSVAMELPENWELSTYTATHKPSGTCLWVANGWTFFDIYGVECRCLGLIERFFMFRKYKLMIARKIAQQLNGGGV
jgi:hypothetical protein